MKNPFKRFGSYNPSQYSEPRSSNKLIIVAGIVTFIIIIVVMFESVVAAIVIKRTSRSLSIFRIKNTLSFSPTIPGARVCHIHDNVHVLRWLIEHSLHYPKILRVRYLYFLAYVL